MSVRISDEQAVDLYKKFMNSSNDEACLSLLMRLHCIFGDIRKLLKTSYVTGYKFEHHLGHGRVDLVLFHADGGVSLVEIKSDNSVRDIVSGIGQLFLYEALYKVHKPLTKRPAYIRKYLVSPVSGRKAAIVDEACVGAGVIFVSYAGFKDIKESRNRCINKWAGNGS